MTQAREITGRTILRDYRWASYMEGDDEVVGPVHLFACHKAVSETQAMALLGYPDATIVSPPFGVYVADNVRKIQIILLKNCRDVTMTWHEVQRVFNWLVQEDEDSRLVKRASARKRIVQTIAEEQVE